MIPEVENEYKILEKQGLINEIRLICRCGDITENANGICDTCKLLNDMNKRDETKSFFKSSLKFITSWGFIIGFIIGFAITELIIILWR